MTARHLACTLFEGDYHLGAAALLNSLHRAGFTGTFVCGHRGAPPPWMDAARALGPGITVQFRPVTTAIHLTNHKPVFLQECWQAHPEATSLHYFDPDIVVKAPWSVLARWARDGLALCEDMNAYFPERHPYRLAWTDFLERSRLETKRSLGRYYNAGFIGLSRAQEGFLETWADLVRRSAAETGSLEKLKHAGPHTLFHSADQDALNLALLLTTHPINAAGPEAMDFVPGGHLLSHAAGGAKPWRGGFLRAALGGMAPGLAQKNFFAHVTEPIQVLPSFKLARLRASLRLAAFIGRFYHRR